MNIVAMNMAPVVRAATFEFLSGSPDSQVENSACAALVYGGMQKRTHDCEDVIAS